MKRKLGINSDCILGANELATLETIKETGFECFFTANINPRVAYALRKKADDLGLEFEFIHAPFRGINDMWLEGDAYRELYDGIIRAIDAAEVSGAKHIILHVSSGWNPPPVCDLGLSRYDEIVKLVNYGRGVNDCNLKYFTNEYVEDYITLKGNDWTYSQHRKIDTKPTHDDFAKVVKDYLAWRVSEIFKHEDSLGKQ